MFDEETYAKNVAHLYLLRESIEKSYPKGHHVAVAQGKVVADAPTPGELFTKLQGMGIDPQSTICEEVGLPPPSPAAFVEVMAHFDLARARRG